MSNLDRFLGGSPGAVLAKLIFLSLLVGAVMALLGVTPFGLVEGLYRWIASLFDFSLDTLIEIGRWIAYGAIIVIPIWLITRLFGRR